MPNAGKLDQPTVFTKRKPKAKASTNTEAKRIAVVIQAEFSHHCSYWVARGSPFRCADRRALLDLNLRGFNGKRFDSLSAYVRQPLAKGWADAT
jgi:hypothetical protein